MGLVRKRAALDFLQLCVIHIRSECFFDRFQIWLVTIRDNLNSAPPYDSVALTDQIRALDKTRLRRKSGTMSVKGLNAMKLGIERLFGL